MRLSCDSLTLLRLPECPDDLLLFVYFNQRWNIFQLLAKKDPQIDTKLKLQMEELCR